MRWFVIISTMLEYHCDGICNNEYDGEHHYEVVCNN